MSLTDHLLMELEKKYFFIIKRLLEEHLGEIINQLYSQQNIPMYPSGTNTIQKGAQNIIEGIIDRSQGWNIASMGASSDSCFECGDSIIHLEVKTIKITDDDYRENRVLLERNQTSYNSTSSSIIAGKNWLANLRFYENHIRFGKVPNLTYAVRIAYSPTNLVEEIRLMSIPNGQFYTTFFDTILYPGKRPGTLTRPNIRFKMNEITQKNGHEWRSSVLFKRQ
ncbi:hypothetical protein [Peribacillus alkalitolerans]|uniref:hypothetical protein n=1 Tax=Peribacillus alkalitolerans TaxID=1550385 RepID=UPI0013D7929D|nr:hypothetical protein [Peribacillus alkalitolerans]